jgi:hypothetical protein
MLVPQGFAEERIEEHVVMQLVKGMVQVGGSTYRIVRLERGHYEVVRILDDVSLGTFRARPAVQGTSGNDEELVLLVARAAIQTGKTSWVGRLIQ